MLVMRKNIYTIAEIHYLMCSSQPRYDFTDIFLWGTKFEKIKHEFTKLLDPFCGPRFASYTFFLPYHVMLLLKYQLEPTKMWNGIIPNCLLLRHFSFWLNLKIPFHYLFSILSHPQEVCWITVPQLFPIKVKSLETVISQILLIIVHNKERITFEIKSPLTLVLNRRLNVLNIFRMIFPR